MAIDVDLRSWDFVPADDDWGDIFAIDLGRWRPELHPRDSHGRFRNTWRLPDAAMAQVERLLRGFNPPPLRSDRHAASYLKGQRGPRSKKQQDALDYFLSREGNEDIQSTLRGGYDPRRPEPQSARISELDGMMRPLEHDLILSRVLGPDAFGLPPERLGEVEEWTGRRVNDKGFSPMNAGTAHPIGAPHIEMRVLVPKGTKAIIVGSGDPNDPNGRTVILDREQPLRIGKVEKDGRGGFYALATVGPTRGAKGEQPTTGLGRDLPAAQRSPAIEATPDEFQRRGLEPEAPPGPQEQPERFGPATPAGPAPVAQAAPAAPAAPPKPAPEGPPLEQPPPARAIREAGGRVPTGAGRVTDESDLNAPEAQAPAPVKRGGRQVIPEPEARLRDREQREVARQKMLDEREARLQKAQEQLLLAREREIQRKDAEIERMRAEREADIAGRTIRADEGTQARLERLDKERNDAVVKADERNRQAPGWPATSEDTRIAEHANRIRRERGKQELDIPADAPPATPMEGEIPAPAKRARKVAAKAAAGTEAPAPVKRVRKAAAAKAVPEAAPEAVPEAEAPAPPVKRVRKVAQKVVPEAAPEAAPEAPPAKKAARAVKKVVPEVAPEAAAPQNLQEAARDLPPDEFQRYLRSHIDELMKEFPEAPPARKRAARQAKKVAPEAPEAPEAPPAKRATRKAAKKAAPEAAPEAPAKKAPAKKVTKAAPEAAPEAPAKKAAARKVAKAAPAPTPEETPAEAARRLDRERASKIGEYRGEMTKDEKYDLLDLAPNQKEEYYKARFESGAKNKGHDGAMAQARKLEPRTAEEVQAEAAEKIRRSFERPEPEPKTQPRGPGLTSDEIRAKYAPPRKETTRYERPPGLTPEQLRAKYQAPPRAKRIGPERPIAEVEAEQKLPRPGIKKAEGKAVKLRAENFDKNTPDLPGQEGGLLRTVQRDLAEGQPAAPLKKLLQDRADFHRRNAELEREDLTELDDRAARHQDRLADIYENAANAIGKRGPNPDRLSPGDKVERTNKDKSITKGTVAKRGRLTYIDWEDGESQRILPSRPGRGIKKVGGAEPGVEAPKAAKAPTLTELRKEASTLNVPGRSRMDKPQLEEALAARRKKEGESDEEHAARLAKLNERPTVTRAAPRKVAKATPTKAAPEAKAPAKKAAAAKKAAPSRDDRVANALLEAMPPEARKEILDSMTPEERAQVDEAVQRVKGAAARPTVRRIPKKVARAAEPELLTAPLPAHKRTPKAAEKDVAKLVPHGTDGGSIPEKRAPKVTGVQAPTKAAKVARPRVKRAAPAVTAERVPTTKEEFRPGGAKHLDVRSLSATEGIDKEDLDDIQRDLDEGKTPGSLAKELRHRADVIEAHSVYLTHNAVSKDESTASPEAIAEKRRLQAKAARLRGLADQLQATRRPVVRRAAAKAAPEAPPAPEVLQDNSKADFRPGGAKHIDLEPLTEGLDFEAGPGGRKDGGAPTIDELAVVPDHRGIIARAQQDLNEGKSPASVARDLRGTAQTLRNTAAVRYGGWGDKEVTPGIPRSPEILAEKEKNWTNWFKRAKQFDDLAARLEATKRPRVARKAAVAKAVPEVSAPERPTVTRAARKVAKAAPPARLQRSPRLTPEQQGDIADLKAIDKARYRSLRRDHLSHDDALAQTKRERQSADLGAAQRKETSATERMRKAEVTKAQAAERKAAGTRQLKEMEADNRKDLAPLLDEAGVKFDDLSEFQRAKVGVLKDRVEKKTLSKKAAAAALREDGDDRMAAIARIIERPAPRKTAAKKVAKAAPEAPAKAAPGVQEQLRQKEMERLRAEIKDAIRSRSNVKRRQLQDRLQGVENAGHAEDIAPEEMTPDGKRAWADSYRQTIRDGYGDEVAQREANIDAFKAAQAARAGAPEAPAAPAKKARPTVKRAAKAVAPETPPAKKVARKAAKAAPEAPGPGLLQRVAADLQADQLAREQQRGIMEREQSNIRIQNAVTHSKRGLPVGSRGLRPYQALRDGDIERLSKTEIEGMTKDLVERRDAAPDLARKRAVLKELDRLHGGHWEPPGEAPAPAKAAKRVAKAVPAGRELHEGALRDMGVKVLPSDSDQSVAEALEAAYRQGPGENWDPSQGGEARAASVRRRAQSAANHVLREHRFPGGKRAQPKVTPAEAPAPIKAVKKAAPEVPKAAPAPPTKRVVRERKPTPVGEESKLTGKLKGLGGDRDKIQAELDKDENGLDALREVAQDLELNDIQPKPALKRSILEALSGGPKKRAPRKVARALETAPLEAHEPATPAKAARAAPNVPENMKDRVRPGGMIALAHIQKGDRVMVEKDRDGNWFPTSKITATPITVDRQETVAVRNRRGGVDNRRILFGRDDQGNEIRVGGDTGYSGVMTFRAARPEGAKVGKAARAAPDVTQRRAAALKKALKPVHDNAHGQEPSINNYHERVAEGQAPATTIRHMRRRADAYDEAVKGSTVNGGRGTRAYGYDMTKPDEVKRLQEQAARLRKAADDFEAENKTIRPGKVAKAVPEAAPARPKVTRAAAKKAVPEAAPGMKLDRFEQERFDGLSPVAQHRYRELREGPRKANHAEALALAGNLDRPASRKTRVNEYNGLTRDQFDALPADRKKLILDDLKSISDSGDKRTIPSNRTSMGTTIRGAEATHVTQARSLRDRFTRTPGPTKAAKPEAGPVLTRLDDKANPPDGLDVQNMLTGMDRENVTAVAERVGVENPKGYTLAGLRREIRFKVDENNRNAPKAPETPAPAKAARAVKKAVPEAAPEAAPARPKVTRAATKKAVPEARPTAPSRTTQAVDSRTGLPRKKSNELKAKEWGTDQGYKGSAGGWISSPGKNDAHAHGWGSLYDKHKADIDAWHQRNLINERETIGLTEGLSPAEATEWAKSNESISALRARLKGRATKRAARAIKAAPEAPEAPAAPATRAPRKVAAPRPRASAEALREDFGQRRGNLERRLTAKQRDEVGELNPRQRARYWVRRLESDDDHNTALSKATGGAAPAAARPVVKRAAAPRKVAAKTAAPEAPAKRAAPRKVTAKATPEVAKAQPAKKLTATQQRTVDGLSPRARRSYDTLTSPGFWQGQQSHQNAMKEARRVERVEGIVDQIRNADDIKAVDRLVNRISHDDLSLAESIATDDHPTRRLAIGFGSGPDEQRRNFLRNILTKRETMSKAAKAAREAREAKAARPVVKRAAKKVAPEAAPEAAPEGPPARRVSRVRYAAALKEGMSGPEAEDWARRDDQTIVDMRKERQALRNAAPERPVVRRAAPRKVAAKAAPETAPGSIEERTNRIAEGIGDTPAEKRGARNRIKAALEEGATDAEARSHGEHEGTVAATRKEVRATVRQQRIRRKRETAIMLGEVDELLRDKPSDRALQHRIRSRAGVSKEFERTDIDDVRDRLLATGTDREKMRAEVKKLAQEAGIKRIGESGQVVPFDPVKHHPGGDASIKAGTPVQITRPGYEWNEPGGTLGNHITHKATVFEAPEASTKTTRPRVTRAAKKAVPRTSPLQAHEAEPEVTDITEVPHAPKAPRKVAKRIPAAIKAEPVPAGADPDEYYRARARGFSKRTATGWARGIAKAREGLAQQHEAEKEARAAKAAKKFVPPVYGEEPDFFPRKVAEPAKVAEAPKRAERPTVRRVAKKVAAAITRPFKRQTTEKVKQPEAHKPAAPRLFRDTLTPEQLRDWESLDADKGERGTYQRLRGEGMSHEAAMEAAPRIRRESRARGLELEKARRKPRKVAQKAAPEAGAPERPKVTRAGAKVESADDVIANRGTVVRLAEHPGWDIVQHDGNKRWYILDPDGKLHKDGRISSSSSLENAQKRLARVAGPPKAAPAKRVARKAAPEAPQPDRVIRDSRRTPAGQRAAARKAAEAAEAKKAAPEAPSKPEETGPSIAQLAKEAGFKGDAAGIVPSRQLDLDQGMSRANVAKKIRRDATNLEKAPLDQGSSDPSINRAAREDRADFVRRLRDLADRVEGKKAAPERPAVKRAAKKAAAPEARTMKRGDLVPEGEAIPEPKGRQVSLRNVQDGDIATWDDDGTLRRGRVVDNGPRRRFVDWEGGRRERLNAAARSNVTFNKPDAEPAPERPVVKRAAPRKVAAKTAAPESKELPPLANGTRRKSMTNVQEGDVVRGASGAGGGSEVPRRVTKVERDGNRITITRDDGSTLKGSPNTAVWLGEAPKAEAPAAKRAVKKAAPSAPEAPAKATRPRVTRAAKKTAPEAPEAPVKKAAPAKRAAKKAAPEAPEAPAKATRPRVTRAGAKKAAPEAAAPEAPTKAARPTSKQDLSKPEVQRARGSLLHQGDRDLSDDAVAKEMDRIKRQDNADIRRLRALRRTPLDQNVPLRGDPQGDGGVMHGDSPSMQLAQKLARRGDRNGSANKIMELRHSYSGRERQNDPDATQKAVQELRLMRLEEQDPEVRKLYDDAISEMDAETKPLPDLPEGTPQSARQLLSDLNRIPLARRAEFEDGRGGRISAVDELAEVFRDIDSGKLQGSGEIDNRVTRIVRRYHESRDGAYQMWDLSPTGSDKQRTINRDLRQWARDREAAGPHPSPTPGSGTPKVSEPRTDIPDPNEPRAARARKRLEVREAHQRRSTADGSAELADMLNQVIEARQGNDDPAAFRRAVRQRLLSTPGEKTDPKTQGYDDLRKALTGESFTNPEELGTRLRQELAKRGITMTSTPGAQTRFNPDLHRSVGGDIPDNANVEVIRPGLIFTDKDGTVVTLQKPVVKRVTTAPVEGVHPRTSRGKFRDDRSAITKTLDRAADKIFGSPTRPTVKRAAAKVAAPSHRSAQRPLTGKASRPTGDLFEGDTDPRGVPVRDFTPLAGGGYTIKNGTAWRRNGVTYVVEHDETGEGKRRAVEAAKVLEYHHQSLPAGARQYQRSYVWNRGSNPEDPEFAKKYGVENFRSAMTAGGGETHIWQPGIKMTPEDKVDATQLMSDLNHEYGHNADIGGISATKGWHDAGANANPSRYINPRTWVPSSAHGGRAKSLVLRPQPGARYKYGVTPYGGSLDAEDFAESVDLYLQGRIGYGELHDQPGLSWLWFRDLFPERAAILDKLFPEVARQQRDEIAKLEAGPRRRRATTS